MSAEEQFGIPPEFVREYDRAIPEKLQKLEILISEFKKSMNLDSLTTLRFAVHKLAGSAGTYGYDSVSVICKEWDLQLLQKIKDFPASLDEQSWIAEMDRNLHQIKEGFSRGKESEKK